jgi:hypothetical protein
VMNVSLTKEICATLVLMVTSNHPGLVYVYHVIWL